MNSKTLRLVLLVSCAHGLVHVYELSLPSLEMRIGADYQSDDVRDEGDPQGLVAARPEAAQRGKRQMGLLSTTWRVPFGFGALAAGLLVDRFGPKPMLLAYLIGCSGACLAVGFHLPLAGLFVTMFAMGAFASIYHPAGLTLISTSTDPETRARALGLHGIFGSAGIAAAPFLVAVVMGAGATWRQCYWLLAVPGVLLAILLQRQWARERKQAEASGEPPPAAPPDEQGHWLSFGVLSAATLLQGFVYAGVLSFLTRYLSRSSTAGGELAEAGYATAFVLALGCLGQYAAGRFARLRLLEPQLMLVTLGNVPLLIWMSLAEGDMRIAAAASFSVVHFMHQPLYNSLVAQYTPVQRRSVCYGLSFAMSFGLGGFGATLVGFTASEQLAYQLLAVVAAVSSALGLVLWRIQPPRP